jgi:ATP-dependent Clp protease ATP-binding subunit ClpA
LPKSKQKKTIGKADIEEIISKIARIPPQTVNQDDRSKLQTIDRDLKNVVFGQEPAIEALASAIKMARAGLVKRTSLSVLSCSPARPVLVKLRSRNSLPSL